MSKVTRAKVMRDSRENRTENRLARARSTHRFGDSQSRRVSRERFIDEALAVFGEPPLLYESTNRFETNVINNDVPARSRRLFCAKIK